MVLNLKAEDLLTRHICLAIGGCFHSSGTLTSNCLCRVLGLIVLCCLGGPRNWQAA